MSYTQEKKDVVFVKLSKVQQKKLSIEEQIDYLKKESEQVLLNAKKHQSKLKEEQDKLLKVVKSQERKKMTQDVKILLGSWVLNKIKHDESFKHHLSDFQQFLNTENKTESNRQKDKDLFKDILFEMTNFEGLSPPRLVLVVRLSKLGIIKSRFYYVML